MIFVLVLNQDLECLLAARSDVSSDIEMFYNTSGVMALQAKFRRSSSDATSNGSRLSRERWATHLRGASQMYS